MKSSKSQKKKKVKLFNQLKVSRNNKVPIRKNTKHQMIHSTVLNLSKVAR